ncbi:carbohydrate ABC transporter permease [Halalkalibacter sp. APA_J-10(15)]|uniref:carbohydrate ABC transporter permease n=1 Tax=Halalkalibacter sp. APA_J-10(15) TaxID=2933805 RepID=UPI001FF55BB6|nr:sugar ABC transporter permease [Halalkalibacter sp. APA_J-10(15)]MCK0470129.1 sugar ABC transporter permease [Halalkalibacter sp. APA_J-10(15)]
MVSKFKSLYVPYYFLFPALLLYAIFFVFPFFFSFVISFSDWNLLNGDMSFVGLSNYEGLFGDAVFWRSIIQTLYYVFVTVPFAVILGLVYAVLIEKAGKLRSFYRFLFFIPVVVSVAAASLSFSLIYSPQSGLLNQFLQMIGIDGVNWLANPNTALLSIMVIGVWQSFGYNVVLYIAGLKQLDQSLYEAAAVDGATPWYQFWRLTIPLLSPVHLFVTVMTMIYSFQVFALVQIITMGGPNHSTNVVVFYIWQEAFRFFNTGTASAAATLLFAVILVLTVIQLKLLVKYVHYQ